MRVALFGCGWIQDFHARGILAHGDELVAVANHREGSAGLFAEKYDIPYVTTDWEALAADASLDAAIVATPNALHAPQAIALLRAGTHVLVEKPMAMDVTECDAMVEASHSTGAHLMVAHCWRFHPDVLALRDRISRGELGDIVKTHGYSTHVGWGPTGWFTDPALSGGGALMDMGVHAIDTARFLLGDPEPGPVSATIGTRYADGRYGVDDDGIVLIEWSNGTNSVVECGWWQPHAGGMEADTEVFGTLGYARIWPPGPSDDHEHMPQSMFTAQSAAFLDAIAQGRPPRPSGEDGRAVIQVVDAAYADAGYARGGSDPDSSST
jgi:predicted dehydrogenase